MILVGVDGRFRFAGADVAVDRHGGDVAGCCDLGHGELSCLVHPLGAPTDPPASGYDPITVNPDRWQTRRIYRTQPTMPISKKHWQAGPSSVESVTASTAQRLVQAAAQRVRLLVVGPGHRHRRWVRSISCCGCPEVDWVRRVAG